MKATPVRLFNALPGNPHVAPAGSDWYAVPGSSMSTANLWRGVAIPTYSKGQKPTPPRHEITGPLILNVDSTKFARIGLDVELTIPGEPAQTTAVGITLSRQAGWRMPPNTVKVCRPGMWGNPFEISDTMPAERVVAWHKSWIGGADWTAWMWANHRKEMLRDAVRKAANPFHELLKDLRGKNLACWCAQGKPCHRDTLLELANAPAYGKRGCPADCGHSAEEHEAFDTGLSDGELGGQRIPDHYAAADNLRQAYQAGESVGILNRRHSHESQPS